jgi:predicted ATPase
MQSAAKPLVPLLGMSVERLSKPDQERFAMLSVFGGEPLTWEIKAVSAVWETSIEETEATLIRFIQRGLVEPRNSRFWMHALLADYAGYLMEEMNL